MVYPEVRVSDPDGDTFTYKWTAPAGITLSATNVAKPVFTAPMVDKDTEYTFTLVVNDGKADSPADQITVWVKNTGGSGVPYVKADSKRVSLYPNPTKGIVYVTINDPFAKVTS